MSKLKILIISPGYSAIPSSTGGAIEKLIEIYLKSNELSNDDIVVYSVKNSNNDKVCEKYKNTEFRIIDKTTYKYKIMMYFYAFIKKMFKIKVANQYIRSITKDINMRHEQNYYDCIIFENGQNFIKYFKNKTNTNSKIILHLHNDYLNGEIKNNCEITSYCDEVWAVSKFIKKRVEETTDDCNKIKVLYNSVDTYVPEKIDYNEISKLRSNYNLNGNFVFLYVGRLMKEKGVTELIESFKKLKYSNIKLLIVGGSKSSSKNDLYVKKIKRISKNNKNIIFTGFIKNSDLYKYYQLANVQIVPSLCNEAFGLIVLEGMRNNLPIIATNTGGIPEVLGKNGIYVSKQNILNELPKKMINILLEKNLKKYIKDYSKILDMYSIVKYNNNFYKLLHQSDFN